MTTNYKPNLTIIGDVHGKYRRYKKITEGCDHSFQLGDMGFDYKPLIKMNIDPDRHKFHGGNHDNMDTYYDSPHSLDDYGMEVLGGLKFFYIRGAYSVDVKGRQKAERQGHPKCWWEQEQLHHSKLVDAIKEYESRRPETMITHTCPQEIARLIGNPGVLRNFGLNPDTFRTPTQSALQLCFDAHRPKVWIFGHFHMDRAFEYKGTLFICLEELQSLDADKKGRFSHNDYSGVLGQ